MYFLECLRIFREPHDRFPYCFQPDGTTDGGDGVRLPLCSFTLSEYRPEMLQRKCRCAVKVPTGITASEHEDLVVLKVETKSGVMRSCQSEGKAALGLLKCLNISMSFRSIPYLFANLTNLFHNGNLLAELIRVDNMFEKLRISLIFINLVFSKSLSLNHRMHNLYTKFVRILEICKQFSHNLVNAQGNIVRRGPVPRFSDLEVVALSLAAESESIDSENWLFEYKLQEYKEKIPNLISRRQFNDRRKKTAGLCETIRKRIALKIDGGEDFFVVDSKPIEVCRPARGKRCKMGRSGDFSKAPDFGYCASQNTYYFGYKLHAVCGLSGVIHSYDLSKASVHDLNYMKDVKLEYHDCSMYGDKGYIGADVQLDLFETAHIRLECPYRLNQKDWKPTFIPFAKARKRIETIFSQLSGQFLVIRNYAKITNGLFARIIGKISALTVLQYVNYINNKPIGRIKYALN